MLCKGGADYWGDMRLLHSTHTWARGDARALPGLSYGTRLLCLGLERAPRTCARSRRCRCRAACEAWDRLPVLGTQPGREGPRIRARTEVKDEPLCTSPSDLSAVRALASAHEATEVEQGHPHAWRSQCAPRGHCPAGSCFLTRGPVCFSAVFWLRRSLAGRLHRAVTCFDHGLSVNLERALLPQGTCAVPGRGRVL